MNTSKKPSHTLYQVIERQGAESIWNRIGAAWMHQDGEGFSITLNAFPVTGNIVSRKNEPKNKEKAA